MRKIPIALALILFSTAAYADFTAKNAALATITFKNSGDCTAVVCVAQQQPVDSTGAAFGVTANPFFVTIGSGKIVSGAIASGAVASGAVASGAFASGALASGSIASGAMVDLGAQADSVCGTSTGTCSAIALLKFLNQTAAASIPAGTNTIGGTSPVAAATGGATPGNAIAPATPAGVNLKASAGTVYGIQATTIQSTPVYLKLYDAASAPTCGSGTPVKRLMIPAANTAANGAGSNISFPVGIAFASGIGYCVTGALADNDTTAITAANTLVNIDWK